MCELLAMSCSFPTHLTISLETLAAHGSPTGRYRDGWGAAFYQGADVALFREPAAAGDSALVRFIETQGPSTALAISHIRRATQGVVSLANCQPFARELAGRMHVFAHNGHVPSLEHSPILGFSGHHPVGTTDSEQAFCALLERIGSLWGSAAPPPLEARLAVVAQFAADLRALGPANFLYADGDALFAHGDRRLQAATGTVESPGLFVLSRHCAQADEAVDGHGVRVAPGFQALSLVASVPLTDERWRPLAGGEIVAIAAGRVVGGREP
jgi:glutamine amidotransferase